MKAVSASADRNGRRTRSAHFIHGAKTNDRKNDCLTFFWMASNEWIADIAN